MIEFCVSLPVFVLAFLGAVDFGFVIQNALLVTSAASAGARYATLPGHSTDVSGMQVAAQLQAAHVAQFQAVATSYCTCPPGTLSVNCNSMCATSLLPAQYVRVATSASIPMLFNLASLPSSVVLSGNAVLRVQRP